MKRTREILIHILPVLLGVLITVALSAMVYKQMIVSEEEGSWEQLDSVAMSMAEKINIRFEDNLNMMQRVADAISMKGKTDQLNTVLDYLDKVQASTMFHRIDILLPDHSVVHQTGQIHDLGLTNVDYDQMVEKGPHYSPRVVDEETGRESVYCVVPIVTDGEVEGLIVGVLDCESLTEVFRTPSFDGKTQLFLIDRQDGNYLMDNWHETLGNLHDLGERRPLEGFETVDFAGEILAGKPGRFGFYSKTNGKPSYMAYVPVESFAWNVAVAAQEEQVLESVRDLARSLNIIALVEVSLLLSYVGWNLVVGNTLVKQRESVQKMELEAQTNKAKSIFLSSVSHDIRTPLNGILGMLDVIDRRSDVPEGLDKDLEKIRVSAEYLVSLADNVLDLNHLESGRGLVEDDHIDLNQLGRELDIIVQPKLKSSNVSFRLEQQDLDHPYVLGSEGYLRRILTNLIGNAIKYNKEGGSVWVTVEELSPQEDRSLYRFTVSDNGIGMSEEFMERIFEAFEQEQAGARSRNIGHGLGLAIVDRMVRKMGGTIQVESKKDVGSIFTVTIPFRWAPEGQEDLDLPGQQDPGAGLTGARILLAEDNELNMEIANLLLTDAGARVTPVEDGALAVEAFAASRPWEYDVVLMDIMMPRMDGCEASLAIRAMDRPDAASIPIIAMTASTFAEDVKRCRESGMDEHIGKPLNMEKLFALIGKYREAYRGTAETEPAERKA